jgi:Skp family chaperone for outer membrane proteins
MNKKRSLFLLPAALLAVSTNAWAANPPPAQPALGGPVIAGICVLDRNAVYGSTKVGIAASQRLRELTLQARKEVEPERLKLEADIKTLQSKKTSMQPAQFAQQERDLGIRARAFQATAQLRSQELEATRVKALKKIAELADPVIRTVYQNRHCGAMFARESLIGSNPALDVTGAVTQGMNAKFTTIAFDREHLPTQTASAAH